MARKDDTAPFDNVFAPTVIKPAKRAKKRPCSLTVVMAIFTAVLVLVVASVTFAITYTTSLKSLRTVGRGYAESLTATAAVRVGSIYEAPAAQLRAFGNSLKRDGIVLPSDDASVTGVMNETLMSLLPLFVTSPDVYLRMLATFDDGSTMLLQRESDATVILYVALNAAVPDSVMRLGFNAKTMRLVEPAKGNTVDLAELRARIGYAALRRTLLDSANGVWSSAIYDTFGDAGGAFALLAAFPLRNRSNFLGTINADVALSPMANFLSTQKLTSAGNTFVLDGNSAILATSHPTPFRTVTTVAALPSPVAPNCAAAQVSATNTSYLVACRSLAKDFPYSPLQTAAGDADLMSPRTPVTIVFKTLFSGDDTVYVSATRIANTLANGSLTLATLPTAAAAASFAMTVLLFVPEADVIGNVVGTRTTVIAIIAVVFVVASVIAAVFIHIVLRPLKAVASNMRSTAKLREVEDQNEGMSRLKEVYDLQLAFKRMNAAIGSFTRYVPRDVVKDLMKSGQMCQIVMEEKTCSMLFVDIANFASLCEHVQAENLSTLVKLYFEQMSANVGAHDGVIDKYIGDCIMAVWGAVFPCEHQEVKAMLCATLMDRETHVAPLATRFAAEGQPLSVRVGVATGKVLAGNMGSSERMSYTVIGDSVNLASRLEALNQQLDTRVVVDEATALKGHQVFCLRKVIKIAFGQQPAVTVYEVMGLLQEIRGDVLEGLRDRRPAFLNDAATDDTSTNHSMSMQSMTTFDGSQRATAAVMVDKARMLHSPPSVVDDATIDFANRFTEAVDQYQAGHFKPCLEILQTLRYPGDVPRSHSQLQQLAEDGARMDAPSLASFDGVWHVAE